MFPSRPRRSAAALAEHPAGITLKALARIFLRVRIATVASLLQTLVSLGQTRALEGGRYMPD